MNRIAVFAAILLTGGPVTVFAVASPPDTAYQADSYCLHNIHALQMNTANLNNPRTEYCYGVISHSQGDETVAIGHFLKSAQAGYAPAQVVTGAYYASGIGVAPDPAEGLKWLKAGADQGSPEAEYAYGRMLVVGTGGMAADPTAGIVWLEKAADAGDSRAQTSIADMHADGLGVARDDGEALRLYRLAAAQGNPVAIFAEGTMIAAGRGTAADKSAGMALIEKAARMGISKAELVLASAYAAGDGLAHDDVAALTWYETAAVHQGKRAPEADAVEARLTPEQVRRAKSDASKLATPQGGVR